MEKKKKKKKLLDKYSQNLNSRPSSKQNFCDSRSGMTDVDQSRSIIDHSKSVMRGDDKNCDNIISLIDQTTERENQMLNGTNMSFSNETSMFAPDTKIF